MFLSTGQGYRYVDYSWLSIYDLGKMSEWLCAVEIKMNDLSFQQRSSNKVEEVIIQLLAVYFSKEQSLSKWQTAIITEW